MASGKSERTGSSARWTACSAKKKPQPVIEITESMIRKDPHDWEALYRQGLALAELDKPTRPAQRFQAHARAGDSATTSKVRPFAGPEPRPEAERRAARASASASPDGLTARKANRTGLSDPHGLRTSRTARSFPPGCVGDGLGPGDFGQARMAAWAGWSASPTSRAQGKSERGRREISHGRAKRHRPMRVHSGTGFIFRLLRYDNAGAFAAGKTLSRSRADRSAGALGLSVFARPAAATVPGTRYRRRPVTRAPKDNTPAARKAELDHVLPCYPCAASPPARAGAGPDPAASSFKELKRAKRIDDEEQLYRESIGAATQIGADRRRLRPGGRAGRRRQPASALRPLRTAAERARTQYYTTGSFYFSGTARRSPRA